MNQRVSRAAENNKGPILQVLRNYVTTAGELLEIGSGTGQHAAWLAPHLPAANWQPSEQRVNLPALQSRLAEHPASNLYSAIALAVEDEWPQGPWRYIFTANTFHIMSCALVERCIEQACRHLLTDGHFMVYGPFNYNGTWTAESNRRFDQHLKATDGAMGLRNQEWIVTQFHRHGWSLLRDHAMPANNRLLVFQTAAGRI